MTCCSNANVRCLMFEPACKGPLIAQRLVILDYPSLWCLNLANPIRSLRFCSQNDSVFVCKDEIRGYGKKRKRKI